jgi:tripartite-type tricarboxylate transporter receptor subunit TctC
MFLKTLLLSVLFAVSTLVHAGDSKEVIRIVIGFSAGGGSDRIARGIQEIIAKETGKTVIVEYRPGAGGDIALREVVTNNNQETVLLLKGTSNIVIRSLKNISGIDYSVLQPVAYVGYVPLVLVASPLYQHTTIDSLIKSNAAEISNFGSAGIGSGSHISGEIFFNRIDRKMLHVPYRGTSMMMPDLLAGRVDLAFGFPAEIIPHVKDNRVVPLAVAGASRLPQIPEVPTLDEKKLNDGYGKIMYVFFANPGADPAVVKELQQVLNHSLQTKETAKRLQESADLEVEPKKVLGVNKILDSEFKQYRELTQRVPVLLAN